MIKYRVEVDKYKNVFWYKWKTNELHREDGPAIGWNNGDKEWWLNGKPHRENGPAIETSCVGKEWYLNGKRHREDGPAIEWTDGTESWYLDGECLNPEARWKCQIDDCEGKVVEIDGVEYELRKK